MSPLIDTGPSLAGGPRAPGKSRGTGRKFASYRGERMTQPYLLGRKEASRDQGGGPCRL